MALNAHLAASIALATTEPWHLVQAGDLRLTDGPTTTWAGSTWLAYPGLVVEGEGMDGSGQSSGVVRLPNHDGAISGLVFAGGATDIPLRVWTVYGDGPHALTDAVLLTDGLLDGASIVGVNAELEYTGIGGDARLLPRLRVSPPTFNFLPAEGTVLRWADTEITLEGSR